MQKISSQQARGLLKTASVVIRKLAAERDDLRSENEGFKKEARARQIAQDMEEKGLNGDLSFEEKVASLKVRDNLDVTEEAVKMASPQAQLFDVGDDTAGSSLSAFETYILTGEEPA